MGFFKWLDKHIRESNRWADKSSEWRREWEQEHADEERMKRENRELERNERYEWERKLEFELRGGDSCENCRWYDNVKRCCTLPDNEGKDESDYLIRSDGGWGTPKSYEGSRARTCMNREG